MLEMSMKTLEAKRDVLSVCHSIQLGLRGWIALSFLILGLTHTTALFGQDQILPNHVLQFSEDDSYIELENGGYEVFKTLSALTIETWVRWDDLSGQDSIFLYVSGQDGFSIHRGNGTADINFFILTSQGTNRMTMRDYIRIGEWMHVAAVAGPEGMKFYINGNLVGSDPLSVSIDAFGDERSAARGFIVGDEIELQPLRERREDVELLTAHFLHRFALELGRITPSLSENAWKALMDYAFPGNVRELKSILERATIESPAGIIDARQLRLQQPSEAQGLSQVETESGSHGADPELPDNLEEAEFILTRRALTKADGNMSKAAKLLGINRTKIYRILSRGEDGKTAND